MSEKQKEQPVLSQKEPTPAYYPLKLVTVFHRYMWKKLSAIVTRLLTTTDIITAITTL